MAGVALPEPVLRGTISIYSRLLGVRTWEAEVPPGGFTTFGEFFARDLRSDARPIDTTPGALTSPCDGVVRALGTLEGAGFEVKGRRFSAHDLTQRSGWWDHEQGGFVVTYLSPADYHRVHSPLSGELREVWRVGGQSAPVNRVGEALAPWAIVRNERVIFDLDATEGPVVIVMVGALAVRAISVSVPGLEAAEPIAAARSIDRGQEIGVFNLGSTVVMLWRGEASTSVGVGEKVLLGQRVAVR